MNLIHFDTIVNRNAYRNGFSVYKLSDDLKAMLFSSFHNGKVRVSYHEDKGYIVYDVNREEELVVGAETNLDSKLRELANFYIGQDLLKIKNNIIHNIKLMNC